MWSQTMMKYNGNGENNLPEWAVEMYKDNPDLGLVIDKYEQYYSVNPFVKNKHTQYYKRLIREISREQKRTSNEDRQYLSLISKNQSSRTINMSNWQCLGPFDWDHSAAGRSYAPGSAHVYTVEQSISNPNVIYAGTATAGLWRSSNKGISWTALTNNALISTVYAIEIDHTNENVIYASMFNSIYKSTNGGTTFQPTGNSTFQAISLDTRDIRMLPSNNNTVFACTSNALYRTIDGGTTWTNVVSGDFQEVEIHPTNNNVIYAVKKSGTATQFFKSTNGGSSFTQIINGWPVPPANGNQERTEISVSPHNPNYVFAHCSGLANGGSGLYGVYVSSDQGQSWTFRCCGPQPAGPPSLSNPNLMGWSDDGTDDGGQYYYDMGFAVSPTNSDSIFLAGVNLWVSSNGGTSFTCPAKWSHPHKANYVHADIHDINYYNHTRELWIACDGGIFYSNNNGTNFQRRNIGILGTDFWGFGQGWWYGDVMLGGAYHNGTLLKEENVYQNDWLCTDGGDGTLGFVNPGLDRQVYSWFDIKKLKSNRTVSPETRAFDFKPNNTYITGQSNDLLIHPAYYGHWLTGYQTKLYQTKDNGYTFTEIYDFEANIASAAQSWSNPNVLYACTFPGWWSTKRIFRSVNGGLNWVEITPTSAQLNGNIWIPYDIVVDHDDPMKIWIVRTSMYDSNINGFAVYHSTNGGDNWQNISGTGLNGHSPTGCYLQKGTNGGLYIGTRRGVFYKNSTMPEWILYNTGLPTLTHSTRMEGFYRKQKLRNATTRSVWETDFYENSTLKAYPSAQTDKIFCSRDTIYFVDHSVVTDQNVSWSWSFPEGTPASSNLRNPKVIYPASGSYDVTLTVSDIHGSSTKTIQNMIIVENQCAPETIAGKSLLASGTNKHGSVPNANLTNVNTLTVTAWVKPNGIQPDYSAIFMGDGTNAAGFNFKDGTNKLAYHWPGGQWSWNSNINVPQDEWSFVAMVVQPTGITLYCNGMQATHNFTLQATDIPAFRIGSYRNWESRNMNGMIDEVAIYNRALSTNELRELRHLSKKPSDDATLIAYYQFNSNNVNDFDKVGTRHIFMTNNAEKVISSAPVGGGKSQRINVTSGGLKDFAIAGCKIYFPPSGIYANGDMVVTRLDNRPFNQPNVTISTNKYWLINNYGTNTNFTRPDSIRFYDSGNISGGCQTSGYVLQKRNQNEFLNNWSYGGEAIYYNAYNNPPYITLGNNTITTSGQFFMTLEPRTVGNPQEICNGIDDDCDGLVDEVYSLNVTNNNDSGPNTLRAIMNCAQPNEVITIDASIDTITLVAPLLISKNISIIDQNGAKVVIKSNLNLPGFNVSNGAIVLNSNHNISFENIELYQNNNTYNKPVIYNNANLSMTNCIMKGQPDSIIRNETGSVLTVNGTVFIE